MQWGKINFLFTHSFHFLFTVSIHFQYTRSLHFLLTGLIPHKRKKCRDRTNLSQHFETSDSSRTIQESHTERTRAAPGGHFAASPLVRSTSFEVCAATLRICCDRSQQILRRISVSTVFSWAHPAHRLEAITPMAIPMTAGRVIAMNFRMIV